MISDAELYQAFPHEYPNDLTRTTEGELLSFDFDRIEAEKWVGKKWEDISPDLLQECFDIASWLNPRAFQYFFPAFIQQSQVDMKKTSLLVDSLIDMLAETPLIVQWPESLKDTEAKLLAKYPEVAESIKFIDENKMSSWRQERWKLFTKQQWAVIRKWLNWIDQDEKWEVDRNALRKAINKIDSRL
jgi:hypothetical protein